MSTENLYVSMDGIRVMRCFLPQNATQAEYDIFHGNPVACKLYKGNGRVKKQSNRFNAWSSKDQSSLYTVRPSRQARRHFLRLRYDRRLQKALRGSFRRSSFTDRSQSLWGAQQRDSDGGPGDNSQQGDLAPQTGSKRSRRMSGEEGPSKSAKKSKGSDRQSDDGENEDEKEPQTKKKRQPKKRGPRTKNQMPSTQPRDANLIAADKEVAERVAEIIIANDIELKNTQRIAKALQQLRLNRIMPPSPRDQKRYEKRIEDVLGRAHQYPGRNISPDGSKRDGNVWVFWFKDDANGGERYDSVRVWLSLCPEGEATQENRTKLHQRLVEYFNTWPFELPKNGIKNALKQHWASLAAADLFCRPLLIDEVTHSDTLTYQTKAHYIDIQTGEAKRLNVAATATDSSVKDVNVPPLPTINVLVNASRTVELSTPDNPRRTRAPDLSEGTLGKSQTTSLRAQHRAEDAVYWMASQLQGLVATEARMKELYQMYRGEIGLHKSVNIQEGIYGGESHLYSFRLRKKEFQTDVQPHFNVARDLGVKPSVLVLKVYSLNASRATPVLDTILQRYCAGDDIRVVFIEAAMTADCVNMDIRDGVPPSSRCDCNEQRTGHEMHACEGCGKATLCVTRSFDSIGRLVCVTCSKRDQKHHLRTREEDSFAARIAHQSLWLSFRRECAVRNLDINDPNIKSFFDAAWEDLKARLPGEGLHRKLAPDLLTKYVDTYTNKPFDISEERPLLGSNPSRRRYVPHGLTVDAIHRQGSPTYKDLKHTKGNLIVTSNACQMAKGSFNPGVLHEIGGFKSLSKADQASHDFRKQLVAATSGMAEVHHKRRYINNGAGGKEAKFQKIRAEAIAGRTTPNEPGPWEDDAKSYMAREATPYQTGGSSIWDDQTWQNAQACARSMEEYFGVTLHRLRDGTAWMGTSYTNPGDLDRNGVALLCQERLHRMRVECNKKWTTIDSDETLYREILFQYCCSVTPKPSLQWLKGKYGDRLGLPLVLWKNNPLRFSVAHRAHGFQMFTGWRSDGSINVQERIDNDSNNNMLIESWFVNSAKMDMADDYYGDLDNILSSAFIQDNTIYNPQATDFGPTIVVPSKHKRAVEDDIQDEFAGVMFDDPALNKPLSDKPVDEGEGEDVEMTHTAHDDERGGGDNADLQDQVAGIFGVISANDNLAALLEANSDFRDMLQKVQDVADTNDAPQFDQVVAKLFEQFINPNA